MGAQTNVPATPTGEAPLVALGAFVTAIAALHSVQGSDVSMVLWGVAAVCLSTALTHSAWLPKERLKGRNHDVLLCVWLGKLVLTGGMVGAVALLFDRPDAGLFAGLLTGCCLMTGLAVGLSAKPQVTLFLILCLSAGVMAGANLWVPVTEILVLFVLLFTSLVFVAIGLIRSPDGRSPTLSSRMITPFSGVLSRSADILLLPLLFDSREIVIYLTARFSVALFVSAIGGVHSAMLPNLIDAFKGEKRQAFQGIVARASLGAMLISGALALVGVLTAPLILPAIIQSTETTQTLHLLLLAALIPVALGLFPSFMISFAPRKIMMHAYLVVAAVFCAITLVWLPKSPSDLAFCFLFAQVGSATILSLVNFRVFGLLPAVTALLHPSLKLRET